MLHSYQFIEHVTVACKTHRAEQSIVLNHFRFVLSVAKGSFDTFPVE